MFLDLFLCSAHCIHVSGGGTHGSGGCLGHRQRIFLAQLLATALLVFSSSCYIFFFAMVVVVELEPAGAKSPHTAHSALFYHPVSCNVHLNIYWHKGRVWGEEEENTIRRCYFWWCCIWIPFAICVNLIWCY